METRTAGLSSAKVLLVRWILPTDVLSATIARQKRTERKQQHVAGEDSSLEIYATDGMKELLLK